MFQRGAGAHLGIEKCMPGKLPQKHSIVPVGPIHHGGNAKCVIKHQLKLGGEGRAYFAQELRLVKWNGHSESGQAWE